MGTETYIPRKLGDSILADMFKGKAIVINGPRQCGKTTLVKNVLAGTGMDAIWLTGDDDADRELLDTVSIANWRQILGPNRVVVIDEAQTIPRVGTAVKLLVDNFPDVQAILTGSSSFQFMNVTREPLTGRKYEHRLFPFGFSELKAHHGFRTESAALSERLVFGSYPEIVTDPENARRHLLLLADSYLFKDVLQYEGLRKPTLLKSLVRALAAQIGSEVSATGLAGLLGVSRPTVDAYISILERAYIVFSLPSLEMNRRNEIRKGRKVYFWDTGIRNAVLGDFRPVDSRPDSGHLWENYLIAERLKRNAWVGSTAIPYFWRTKDQFEVDYVELADGAISAWEFKWRAESSAKISRAFTNAYPESTTAVVTRSDFHDFLE